MRLVLFALLSGLLSCGGPETTDDTKPETDEPAATTPAENRVVIIGFDGVDPDYIDRWARALPHISKMLLGRDVQRLGTTTPPQSPVAWSSFATSMNPGGHGIFDFVARDPSTYFPKVGTNDYRAATFDKAGRLERKAQGTSPRMGTPFWKVAADAGKRAKVLFVPYSYPPDPLPNGNILSGLGVPDLRLTNSTSFLFSTKLSAEEDKKNASGVDLVRLEGEGPWTGKIDGPKGIDSSKRESIEVEVSQEGDTLTIKAGDTTTTAKQGRYSEWVTLSFPVSNFYVAQSVVRFHAISTGEDIEIYMYPLMVDPAEPYLAISEPEAFAKQLWDAYGPYKTIGWEHDTSSLNAEKVPDSLFVHGLRDNFKTRLKMTLGELEKQDAELFISVFTETDRAAHMMTRLSDPSHPSYDEKLSAEYGGVIKEMYHLMDDAVGKIKEQLKPGDRLIIVSDHGFHSFRQGFNTNTWLLDNGYLALKSGVARNADNTLLPVPTEQIDWSKTKAYAYGTGQIYLNVKGREKNGIVAPGQAKAVATEIGKKLLKVKHNKKAVLSNVYVGSEIYSGAATATRAPDLQLAFVEGYQSSRKTSLGGIPKGLFAVNKKKWSGDHAASDAADTQGILITSLGHLGTAPHIMDIGPTALSLLDVPVPEAYEGKVLERK